MSDDRVPYTASTTCPAWSKGQACRQTSSCSTSTPGTTFR